MSASPLRYNQVLLQKQLSLPFRHQNRKMQTTLTITKTKSALVSALPRLSPNTLKIIALLAGYRFLNSHFIPPLIQAEARRVRGRLLWLYQHKYVNRFRPTLNDQFIYYLDNPASIDQLRRNPAYIPDDLDLTAIKAVIGANRRRDYATALERRAYSQLEKVEHTLMVNRFCAALELGCRHSNGRVQLKSLRREPPAQRLTDRNFQDEVVVKPDLLFTLHLPEQNLDLVYPYEAERGTNTHTFVSKKLRAYHQFIIKQKKHRDAWGAARVHAVLIETSDLAAANLLSPATIHPSIRGITLDEQGLDSDQVIEQRRRNASPLFRLTHSDLFAENQPVGDRTLPLFVRQPEVIFSDIWCKSRYPTEPITLLDP